MRRPRSVETLSSTPLRPSPPRAVTFGAIRCVGLLLCRAPHEVAHLRCRPRRRPIGDVFCPIRFNKINFLAVFEEVLLIFEG